ncbi:MAG: FHA domain-containing protein [Myxococcales bacterium]|nr:FHA domain-containing protein [Myxococcales bacterium]
MIICPKCSKENQDHYKFCLGCGSELPKDGGGGAKPFNPTPPAGVPAQRPPAAPAGPFGSAPAAPAGPFGAPTAPPAGGGFGQAPPPPAGGGFAPVAAPVAPAAGGFGGAPAAPAASGPRFLATCPQCSSPNPGNKRFCLTCGFDLTDNSPAGAAPPAPVAPPVAPVAPVAPSFQPVAAPPVAAPPAPVAPPPPVAAPPAPAAVASAVRLTLIRPDGTEGGTHTLNEGANRIGRTTAPLFANDAYLSPTHATFTVRGTSVTIRDENSLNGVYLRVAAQAAIEVGNGDVFRIGQEILKYEAYPPVGTEADGTERQGAQIEGLVGKISLVIGRETTGNAFPIPVTGLFLGRERGDILFPEDGYVSGLHAQLTVAGGKLTLTDLNSSNGTYIRARGERPLQSGDLLLMGQQLFRVNVG